MRSSDSLPKTCIAIAIFGLICFIPIIAQNDTHPDLRALYKSNTDSCITISTQLLQQAKDSAAYFDILYWRALSHRKVGNYVKAINDFEILYTHAQEAKDSLLLAEAADQIGIMNTFMGNYLKGQEYLLEVAAIYDKVGTEADKAGAKNGLAILYSDLDRNEEAIAMYLEALTQYEAIDDTMGRANVHANLGLKYVELGQYDKAEPHIRMQGHLDSLMQTNWGLGFYYDFMGMLRRKQGRLDEALAWFQTALDLRLTLPSHYNIAESRIGLANTLLDLNRYKEALEQAETVLHHKDNHQSLTQQSSAYHILSKANEKLGKLSTALENYKYYKMVSDSIYKRDHLEEITNKNALYEKAEKEKAIALLDSQRIAQQSKLSFQGRLLWILSIGALLTILLLSLLWISFKKIRKQKREIQKSLEQKDLLLREIHHRVKNNLQLISSLLTLQGNTLENPQAIDAINAGKTRVRSMALIHQDLYNKENLRGINIKDYLEKLVRELMLTYMIEDDQVTLDLDIDNIDLDIDTIVPLGLIINELITNTLKYAFPDHRHGQLSVSLRHQNERLKLVVEDDGIGAESDKSTEGSGSFGTKLIQSLTEQLGGIMKTYPKPGYRTEIEISNYQIAH